MAKEIGSQNETETSHGESDGAAPPPAVVVEVLQPDNGNEVETDEAQAEEDAEFARLAERIAAVDNRVSELSEGQGQWQTTTETSLRQEIADLKATLDQVGINLPMQIAELQAELTRISQDLHKAAEQPEPLPDQNQPQQMAPPPIPPDNNPQSEEGAAHHSPEAQTKKRQRRVI